jgi:hypothetical protein
MTLADALDRLSICNLKIIAGGKKHMEKKRHELSESLRAPISHPTKRWFVRLLIWNSMIWANEAAIRDAQKVRKLSTEEVGRRALAIRKYNKERMKVKGEIAKWAGETVDKKVQHASE